MGLVISVQNRTAVDVGINDKLYKSGVEKLVTVRGPTSAKLEMINRITRWQNVGYVLPLICNNDSTHELLEPKQKITALGVIVVLECLTCDYE